MTRIPYVRREELGPEGQQLWDGIVSGQGDLVLTAHFLVAAAALDLLEPGSAIVFISSAASLRAATGIPAYDASKAALLGICRQVAREGMARGIRANLVVPSLDPATSTRTRWCSTAARPASDDRQARDYPIYPMTHYGRLSSL